MSSTYPGEKERQRNEKEREKKNWVGGTKNYPQSNGFVYMATSHSKGKIMINGYFVGGKTETYFRRKWQCIINPGNCGLVFRCWMMRPGIVSCPGGLWITVNMPHLLRSLPSPSLFPFFLLKKYLSLCPWSLLLCPSAYRLTYTMLLVGVKGAQVALIPRSRARIYVCLQGKGRGRLGKRGGGEQKGVGMDGKTREWQKVLLCP